MGLITIWDNLTLIHYAIKNSFSSHLNIDIETSQLNLLVRTFQIRALILLKVFAPWSTLSW